MKTSGAAGQMTLLVEQESGHEAGQRPGDAAEHEVGKGTDGQRVLRHIQLEAQGNGKTLNLVERDSRKAGVFRVTRYEITPAELIASIRRLGREVPHGIAVPESARVLKAGQLMRPLDVQRAASTASEPASSPALGLTTQPATEVQTEVSPEGR